MPSLVQPSTTAAPADAPRAAFWRGYMAWLNTASTDEMAILECALAPHAHEVRSLASAVSDAVRCGEPMLPPGLLDQLLVKGWHVPSHATSMRPA